MRSEYIKFQNLFFNSLEPICEIYHKMRHIDYGEIWVTIRGNDRNSLTDNVGIEVLIQMDFYLVNIN